MNGTTIIVNQKRPSTTNIKPISRRDSVTNAVNKENVKSSSQRSLSKNRNNSSGKKKKTVKAEQAA